MIKRIVIGIGLVSIATVAYAYRVSKPERMTDYDERGLVIINENLEKLWDITNGRYNINVQSSTPTGNSTEGDLVAFYNTTNQIIYSYINGSWRGFMPVGNVSAGDYINIAGNGTITFLGDARHTNNIWIDAGGIKAPGAKPATAIAHGTLETPAWQFGAEEIAGNQETVSFSLHIASRMDRSIAPTVCIGWSSTTTAGNVKWQLEYLWTSVDESTAAAAQETLYATTAVSSVAEGLVISIFTGIDLPSATDACLHCRLKRLSADAADNVADDVELHGVVFTWTSNKLGGTL